MNTKSLTLAVRVLLFLTISFVAVFSFKVFTPSRAQNADERELEDKIPKHVPIKVKIRQDKEQKIKDMRNDQGVRDFELEVTNTSDKPIYFLDFYIVIPEIITENGGTLGMPLRYGRLAFIKHNARPLPEDIPLKPGETYVFKIPEMDQKGWYRHKSRGYMEDPKKIQLIFTHLSFGDGTGFDTTGALPYPYEKKQSFASSDRGCPQPRVVALTAPSISLTSFGNKNKSISNYWLLSRRPAMPQSA
jgi:hypothetical protein